jgi:hypothetical protein
MAALAGPPLSLFQSRVKLKKSKKKMHFADKQLANRAPASCAALAAAAPRAAETAFPAKRPLLFVS